MQTIVNEEWDLSKQHELKKMNKNGLCEWNNYFSNDNMSCLCIGMLFIITVYIVIIKGKVHAMEPLQFSYSIHL